MKYTVTVDVHVPRERVVELISDPELQPAWLRGLVSHELVSGVQGQVGAVSRVVMASGGAQMEATETVTRREPSSTAIIPQVEVVHYARELVAHGMRSLAHERFTAPEPGVTRWESVNEYVFDDTLTNLISPLMRRNFRKQSLKHMNDFKNFAENGVDVRDDEGR